MKQKGMLPGKQCMCLNVFYTGVKGKKQVHCSNGSFGDVTVTRECCQVGDLQWKNTISCEAELALPKISTQSRAVVEKCFPYEYAVTPASL